MKIGLVTPGGFDRSGRERVVPALLWLVERLARRHDVHVYTLYQYPHPDEYPLLGATVHNVGRSGGPFSTLRLIQRALRLLKNEHGRERFDVLHGMWASESGLIAATAGRWFGIPSVISLLGGELTALPDIGYGAQLRWKSRLVVHLTLRRAGIVTTPSEFMRRSVLRQRPDVRRIPLGVDTRLFSPPPQPPPGPPWRLLHVADLNRVKDQPMVLRALKRIRESEPAVHLGVIGQDTLNGEIQRLAHDLGLDDTVTFHGFQPSDVVARALESAHLLLHSSRHEAGQMVTLEAAACAVPTVGTAVGHVDDLAPEAAVAVPVGDDGAMAWAALALLHDDASRRALGERALAFARAHDADWTAARFENLYVEAIRRSRGVEAATETVA